LFPKITQIIEEQVITLNPDGTSTKKAPTGPPAGKAIDPPANPNRVPVRKENKPEPVIEQKPILKTDFKIEEGDENDDEDDYDEDDYDDDYDEDYDAVFL